MVCGNSGIYRFLGPSEVLTTVAPRDRYIANTLILFGPPSVAT